MIVYLLLCALHILTGEAVNVQLILPKFILAGSSPTLLCRYHLEDETLYAVKWYRGQHEFYRYVPGARPQMVAFPLGGITVDLLGSGPDKVKLVNVPKSIGGKIDCEVSVEHTFKTTTDSKNLNIVDLDIDKPYLNVSSNVFDPRNDIDITCSAQKTDPHSLINFYVDYVKVKRHYITYYENDTARMDKKALMDIKKATTGKYVSPIWVRCDASLRGIVHRSSQSVPIIPSYHSVSQSKSSKHNINYYLVSVILFMVSEVFF